MGRQKKSLRQLSQNPLHQHGIPLFIAFFLVFILFSLVSSFSVQADTLPTPTPSYSPVPISSSSNNSFIGEPQQNHITPPSANYFPPATNSATLNADVLFSLVNEYRQQVGLAPFQKNDQLCTLATNRAPEAQNEIYVTGNLHKGMYERSLPYWNTENIIAINSETAALNWWLSDAIHKAAVLGNYQYSCTACQGNTCVEEFSNFEKK
ncbi:MAG TPA: CAP domain-containing protein [Patescibacteria group bacterium]|nr:CAP domain-containing protein [Patescibacteria group bacterium]